MNLKSPLLPASAGRRASGGRRSSPPENTGTRPRVAGRRGGSPASHDTRRRQRRCAESPTRGGRRAKCEPRVDGISNTVHPWVLLSVGSSTCTVQIMQALPREGLGRLRQSSGSARMALHWTSGLLEAGGAAANVRRSTALIATSHYSRELKKLTGLALGIGQSIHGPEQGSGRPPGFAPEMRASRRRG